MLKTIGTGHYFDELMKKLNIKSLTFKDIITFKDVIKSLSHNQVNLIIL